MLVADLLEALDARFPMANAADWDPVGLQIGGSERPVGSVGVCHEPTEHVVAAALDAGITTIVTYHPVLLHPTNRLLDGPTAIGRSLRLAERGVSVVTVHTALDAAEPGTGDHLLTSLGWNTAGRWATERADGTDAIGRFAEVDGLDGDGVLATCRAVLGSHVRATAPRPSVDVVAVVPGSGASFIDEAVEFADVLITGDVSHHRARSASDRGLMVIDAGHAATEFAGIQALYAAIDDIVGGAVFVGDDPTPWEG